MEEATVISLIRAGRVDAFSGVVEEYQQPIIRYLYRLTGDFVTAQDLAQDTFVQAYQSILKTNSDIQLKAWLYKIATNNARQVFRRRKVLGFISFDGHKEDAVIAVDDTSVQTGENMAVLAALKKVPLEQRECLVLHFVEGFKYREIGAALGISEDAVRMRITRGKQAFLGSYKGGDSNEV